jgi:16S rRNA A1518/A1519 N6-dimethyltransferase RsmA/KsgA/DIM1 with predicted DNA glycosylase/AP lyase activity
MDVLNTDWPGLAAEKGGCLNVIGNLPYYIVSQVLFSLADSHRSVDTAVLTMQLEVLHLIILCWWWFCYGVVVIIVVIVVVLVTVVIVVVVIINNITIIILLLYLNT